MKASWGVPFGGVFWTLSRIFPKLTNFINEGGRMSIESILIWIRNYIQENEGPLVAAFILAVLFFVYRGYIKGVRWRSFGNERDLHGIDVYYSGDGDGEGGESGGWDGNSSGGDSNGGGD
jgi:hypothetical protein